MKLIHLTDTHFVPTGETLYRADPFVVCPECEPAEEEVMQPLREWVQAELTSGDLSRFEAASDLLDYFRDERITTPTLLELISTG